MEITEHVSELVSEYLKNNNVELVDVIYRREQGGMTLRLVVDKSNGITLGECEALNNYLSERLDKEDVINEHFILEVSSPGLDRPVTTDRDFERVMNKDLDITTYMAIDSRKTHEGKLVGMDKDNIVIESNGVSTVIPRSTIARARLKINF